MIEQVKANFQNGVEKVKWFSELFSERVKAEMAVFKLLGEAEKLKKERARLAKLIGERVFDTRESLAGVEKDQQIKDTLREMEMITEELNIILERAAQVSSTDHRDGA